MTTINLIIAACGIPAAVGGVIALIYKGFKWLERQKQQDVELKELRENHENDMKTLGEELTVLCYASLACLDGLKQLGANGNVTKAHDKLDKHLNQKAHK